MYSKLAHWLRTFQANVSSPNSTLFNTFQRVPHTLRDFARTHIYSNFLFSKESFSGEKKTLTSYFGIYGHSYLIFPPFHSIKHHVLPREVSHAFSLFHPYLGLPLIHTGETTKVLADTAGCPPISSPPSLVIEPSLFNWTHNGAGIKTKMPSLPFFPIRWLHGGQGDGSGCGEYNFREVVLKGGVGEWPPCFFLPAGWNEHILAGNPPVILNHEAPWKWKSCCMVKVTGHKTVGPRPHAHFGHAASRLLDRNKLPSSGHCHYCFLYNLELIIILINWLFLSLSYWRHLAPAEFNLPNILSCACSKTISDFYIPSR